MKKIKFVLGILLGLNIFPLIYFSIMYFGGHQDIFGYNGYVFGWIVNIIVILAGSFIYLVLYLLDVID